MVDELTNMIEGAQEVFSPLNEEIEAWMIEELTNMIEEGNNSTEPPGNDHAPQGDTNESVRRSELTTTSGKAKRFKHIHPSRRKANLELLNDRRRMLVVKVQEGNQFGLYLITCGGPMGDSNEPKFFMLNYHQSIIGYLIQTKLISDKLTMEHPFIQGWNIDLSVYIFIDDLLRMFKLINMKLIIIFKRLEQS